ncbi:mCG146163, partial [Mus musculus]
LLMINLPSKCKPKSIHSGVSHSHKKETLSTVRCFPTPKLYQNISPSERTHCEHEWLLSPHVSKFLLQHNVQHYLMLMYRIKR